MSVESTSPIVRPAARVILFDPDDRVLLFEARVPPRSRPTRVRSIWITPGGGVQPGETYEDAVRRELWEETGLRDAVLGPCVWTRDHVFEWDGRLIDQRERYYVARCERFELDARNWQPEEMTFLMRHRWWAIDEILTAPDVFVPANMGTALKELLCGYPAEPIPMGV